MERIPRPGEFYRHFKDKLYQVIAIAQHTETGEQMVVYQALYGNYGIYVRPLSMFISQVDHEKYPDVKQKYRFERVDVQSEGNGSLRPEPPEENGSPWPEHPEERGCVGNGKEKELSPLILPFIESDSYEQKLEILAAMRGKVGQEEIDSLYVALDLPQRTGDIEGQLNSIEKYLLMQQKFDGNRLR